MTTQQRQDALVLGGGGPVGASWTAALLHGLRGAGVPLDGSGPVLGTSAGAVVGAWLTIQPDGLAGVPALMRRRAAWHARNAASGHQDTALFNAVAARADPGRAAAAALPPISVAQAEELWRAMLPEGGWPSRLRLVSVNAGTGQPRVWTGRDGLPLAVGVACSTAAPGIAPPVSVDGEVWLDGGVRTGTNADLVLGPHPGGTAGPGRVLVVAPLASEDVAREAALLTGDGHRVRVIVAKPFYDKALDLIDPRFIDVGATAGADQARDLAPELRSWYEL